MIQQNASDHFGDDSTFPHTGISYLVERNDHMLCQFNTKRLAFEEAIKIVNSGGSCYVTSPGGQRRWVFSIFSLKACS